MSARVWPLRSATLGSTQCLTTPHMPTRLRRKPESRLYCGTGRAPVYPNRPQHQRQPQGQRQPAQTARRAHHRRSKKAAPGATMVRTGVHAACRTMSPGPTLSACACQQAAASAGTVRTGVHAACRTMSPGPTLSACARQQAAASAGTASKVAARARDRKSVV